MSSEDRSLRVDRRKFLAWGAAAAASAGLAPLLATGCGSSAPAAPTSAPAASGAAAPAAKGPAIELKMSHHEPATGPLGQAYQKWADGIGQKSGGRLKITVFPSETLGKANDAYNDVTGGVADIAWVIPTFTPGQFPLSEMFNMPMIGIENSGMGSKVTWEWYTTNPVMQKEWSNVKVLTGFCNGVFVLGTKKPVRKLEDANGLKLRASGFGGTNFTKAINASPVNVNPPDIYESMSKGVLDGYFWDWQAIASNRLYEVSSYWVDMTIWNGYNTLVMNKAKWDSLPQDLQKLLDDNSGGNLAQTLSQAFDGAKPAAADLIAKAKGEIVTFSPDEQARWKALAKPVWSAWVESVKGKLDGQAELDKLLAIVQKYATKK